MRGDSTSTASAYDLIAVTESDADNDPGGPFRGLLITVAGTVKITTMGNSDIAFPEGSLAVGVIHPIRFRRVWSTGSTATVYGVI